MRLILGFGVVLILTSILGIIGIREMKLLTDLTAKMYKHPMQINKEAKSIKTNVFAMQSYMNKVALANYNAEINAIKITISEYEKEIYKSFEIINNISFEKDENQIKKVFESFEKWTYLNNKVLNLFQKREKIEASNLFQNETSTEAKKFRLAISFLIKTSDTEADSYLKKAKKQEENMIKTMIILLIFIISIGILFSFLIIRTITFPINKIVENIKAIAKGDFFQKIIIHRNDEIGKLAMSIKEMQINLKEKNNFAKNISMGDFSQKISISTKKDLLAQTMNEIVDTLNEIVKQANSISLGNYSINIQPRSEKDTIRIALQKMVKTLREVDEVTKQIAKGDFMTEIVPKSEKDVLSISLNKMIKSLRDTKRENYLQNIMKTGQNILNEKMRGDLDVFSISKNVITYLSKFLDAKVGVFYLYKNKKLELINSYAFVNRKSIKNKFEIGEGLVGQCALEKKIITVNNLPKDYMFVQSALGNAVPSYIIVVPILFEKEIKGVMEFGIFRELQTYDIEFLNSISENIGIVLNSSQSRNKMQKLLEERKTASEILQTQQEELETTNEELETQTSKLQKREEKLKNQQIELEKVNRELLEKTNSLEKQKDEISNKNKEIAQKIVEIKKSSQYKSEFLANMSHELRTPLNSLLILSESLSENKEKNLLNSQKESAEIIHKSGKDLLILINDILDLSKIEAGKMTVNLEKLPLREIIDNIISSFHHNIKSKNLNFKLNIEKNVPHFLKTDVQKLGQIIKNLLSNSLKFTSEGEISLNVYCVNSEIEFKNTNLKKDKVLAISVKDTGIGIHKDKQKEIFEAFLQADGTISRKFGGTGLGLSISKELTKLLGGEIFLESKIGEGSTFTIYFPYEENNLKLEKTEKTFIFDKKIIKKDNNISKETKNILLIEDNKNLIVSIKTLFRNENINIIAVTNGNEALQLLRDENNFDCVILDIGLPDISGIDMLRLLYKYKTKKMPPIIIYTGKEPSKKEYKDLKKYVHSIVVKDLNSDKLLLKNTNFILNKMEKKFFKKNDVFFEKKILIVDDDMRNIFALSKILRDKNMKVVKSMSGISALKILENEKDIDLILMDIMMPKMNGYETIQKIRNNLDLKEIPIIALTAKAMKEDKEKCLSVANAYISKPINMKNLFDTMKNLL